MTGSWMSIRIRSGRRLATTAIASSPFKGTCNGRNDLLDHVVRDGEHARRNDEA